MPTSIRAELERREMMPTATARRDTAPTES